MVNSTDFFSQCQALFIGFLVLQTELVWLRQHLWLWSNHVLWTRLHCRPRAPGCGTSPGSWRYYIPIPPSCCPVLCTCFGCLQVLLGGGGGGEGIVEGDGYGGAGVSGGYGGGTGVEGSNSVQQYQHCCCPVTRPLSGSTKRTFPFLCCCSKHKHINILLAVFYHTRWHTVVHQILVSAGYTLLLHQYWVTALGSVDMARYTVWVLFN